MNIIGIIPARMKSSRLPGKAMKKIVNIPMIGHVYLRSKLSRVLKEIYVATCDVKIKNYIESINGKVVMTSSKHKRADDRTEEALRKIESIKKKKIDLIVMIQGDEPLLEPQMINQVVNIFRKKKYINISNLYTELKKLKEIKDANRVKVVLDSDSNAIYFSRKAIIAKKIKDKKIYYKQGNVFCFNRKALKYFVSLKPTNLEKVESVDMNRLIEKRYKVRMIKTKFNTINVDNQSDLRKAKIAMKNDKYFKSYSKKC